MLRADEWPLAKIVNAAWPASVSDQRVDADASAPHPAAIRTRWRSVRK
jgi:hypothetical protein